MLDNFELIKPFFDDVGHYTFLHCQIVQRAKEHPNEKITESAINHYLFRSWEHLLSKRDEIIALCELYGARAYINLSPKSYENVNKEALAELAKGVVYKWIGSRDPHKLIHHILGSIKGRPQKWMIDIDDISLEEKVLQYLKKKDKQFATNTILYAKIPTVHGEHLIVSPFNRKAFEEVFPEVDVHPNSMGTLLYYPNKLDHG